MQERRFGSSSFKVLVLEQALVELFRISSLGKRQGRIIYAVAACWPLWVMCSFSPSRVGLRITCSCFFCVLNKCARRGCPVRRTLAIRLTFGPTALWHEVSFRLALRTHALQRSTFVRSSESPHWGLNPGPYADAAHALPLSYRGCWEPRFRFGYAL